MNLGAVIEVAIGLILMYLLLSLLVTAVNEVIAQLAGIRARHLQSALRQMLNLKAKPGDADNLALFDAIRNSSTLQIAGAISKTSRSGGGKLPSYLKRDNFLAALREAIPQVPGLKPVVDGAGKPIAVTAGSDIAMLIQALPDDSQIKRALAAAIGDARAVATDAEQRIGDWFDGMMERATGAYKRWMSTFSLCIGFALAVAFNCDTIGVADKLAKNPVMRAEVVKVAEGVAQRCAGTDGAPPLTAAGCKDAQQNLQSLSALPIGGAREIGALSLAGWLLTALAVTLGAPFWFDMLSKVMNVRASFKKP